MDNAMPTNDAAKHMIQEAVDAGLRKIGYPADNIQIDYGYSNFLEQGNGRRETVDVAAFGSPVASLRTCNIGVLVESGVTAERLKRLRALGAPLLFTYDSQLAQISRWRMTSEGLPEHLETPTSVQPDRLSDYFAGHKEWNPEAFRQARTAVFRDEPTQRDFFDEGLLPALEGQLQRKLADQIQNIAARSRDIVNKEAGKNAFEDSFSGYARLLFRLLAARLLSDRGDLPNLTRNHDAAAVLAAVERKYHAGEGAGSSLTNPLVQDQIWTALREGLDLRNLSPETLAFVYENSLVDRGLRRRNGIHATPPQVADYLLRQLPIESLPEADRVVFEPFCGNAPFLLAAMRRLREALTPGRTPDQEHDYLVERLLGIEVLPLAVEIARYGLILGDYPRGNSWQITEANAFEDARFDEYLRRADVVLSNPPHEDFAEGGRPSGAHHNRAAEVLRRVLLHPPKMLGFVMPLSFVDGSDYKSLRRGLVDTYPSLSVTAMPDNVFGKAGQQTALIAGHRLDLEKRYFWAAVSPQDYSGTFAVTGKPSLSENRVSLPTSRDGAPILYQRLQGKSAALWEWLAGHPRLESVAVLHRGLEWVPTANGLSSTASAVSDQEQQGFAPGVHQIGRAVEEYTALQVSYLDVRPERKQWNALRWDWEQPKALISAARISRGLWRSFSIADTEGLYASQRYIGVWPRLTEICPTSVEALSAVLNGPIANAFLHQRCHGRDNNINSLKQIPTPSFTTAQIGELTALVDAYKDLRWEYIDEPALWTGVVAEQGRRALLKIDAAILEAYALPPDLEADLLRHFDGVERRHLPFSFTGYEPEEWAAAKAELADDREARRIADAFFVLMEKRNLFGLSAGEQEEYERLQSQREFRQNRYRALITSGG